MKLKIARQVILFVVLVSASKSIFADTLTVLSNPLPVFSEVQPDGRMVGYSVEYATELLRFAGYQANVKPLPFARLIQEMKNGSDAIATGIVRTAERENDFFWIAPLTANVIGLYSNQLPSTDSLDKLGNTSVAVLRGDYRADLLSNHPNMVLVEVDSWRDAIHLLLAKQVDSLFFSELGIALTCKNANLDCSSLKRIHTYDLQFSYIAMQKSERNREVATKLSRAVEGFMKAKGYAHISSQWVEKLQMFSDSVEVIEGVVSLGSFDASDTKQQSLWVITNLEPLFNYRDERGNLTGYAVELVRNILFEAGLQSEILSAPWQRLIVESELKPDVLVFNLVRTAEREEKYHWLTPITQNAYSVFTYANNSLDLRKWQDMPKKSRISVLSGDFRQDLIKQQGSYPIASTSWKSALDALLTRQADYLFFSDAGLKHFCKDRIEECNKKIKKAFVYDVTTTYLAISKRGTSSERVTRLRHAANTFKQTPNYKQLVKSWLQQYAQQTPIEMHEQDGVLRLWEKQ